MAEEGNDARKELHHHDVCNNEPHTLGKRHTTFNMKDFSQYIEVYKPEILTRNVSFTKWGDDIWWFVTNDP